MFFIAGMGPKSSHEMTVRFVCPVCGVEADQNVIRTANRVSVFFIPLFTMSSKHYNECTNCGAVTELTQEQVNNARHWAGTRGVTPPQ